MRRIAPIYKFLTGVHAAKDAKECAELCLMEHNCNWHTFNELTMICTLTNDCPAMDKTCKMCVSSEIGCSLGLHYPDPDTLNAAEDPVELGKLVSM